MVSITIIRLKLICVKRIIISNKILYPIEVGLSYLRELIKTKHVFNFFNIVIEWIRNSEYIYPKLILKDFLNLPFSSKSTSPFMKNSSIKSRLSPISRFHTFLSIVL